MSDTSGGWPHCAFCGVSFFSKYPPAIDMTTYCVKHHDTVLFAITKDEVMDAYEALESIRLYDTLVRLMTKGD